MTDYAQYFATFADDVAVTILYVIYFTKRVLTVGLLGSNGLQKTSKT